MFTNTILGMFDIPILTNVNGFLIFMILIGGIIGMASKTLAMSSFGAFLIFIKIAIETDLFIYTSLLYALLAIILTIMGLRIWAFATTDSMETV